MQAAPRISDAEWQVMKVVWKRRRCTAHEVIASLAGNANWGPATVRTLLNRLLRKGALRFEKKGKEYSYSPAFPEQEFKAAEAESFLEKVFDGALSPLLSHFVQSRRLSQAEIRELESILHNERTGP